MRFEVQSYDFEGLVSRLAELERALGRSSVELFCDYIASASHPEAESQEWFDLFFLFLGTEEIRRFACP